MGANSCFFTDFCKKLIESNKEKFLVINYNSMNLYMFPESTLENFPEIGT